MAYQQGQMLNTVTARITQARTTARGRIDQVRVRISGMGVGGGGLLSNIMPKGTAGVKTFNQGFARPRIMDRFRQTKAAPGANAMVGPPRVPPGAPIMSFNRPPLGAPIKTFDTKNLRAIKTF